MSVENWAREQAEIRYPDGWSDDATRVRLAREGVHYGIVHAFDALLSDEAVRAMQTQLVSGEQPYIPGPELHLALQAAIAAVTKGGSDE